MSQLTTATGYNDIMLLVTTWVRCPCSKSALCLRKWTTRKIDMALQRSSNILVSWHEHVTQFKLQTKAQWCISPKKLHEIESWFKRMRLSICSILEIKIKGWVILWQSYGLRYAYQAQEGSEPVSGALSWKYNSVNLHPCIFPRNLSWVLFIVKGPEG